MKKKISTKKNLIYNFIYQITVIILPIITAPYISRIIGPDGLGIYSYNHSISLYFTYFAMLGISNFGNREIAKNSDDSTKINKTFSNIYTLQLITSCLILLFYIIYLLLFVNDNRFVSFIMILHVCSPIFDLSWLFFGMQEFKTTSIRQFIIKMLSFISIFVFVKTSSDLWKYVLIMSLSYFLSAISLWIISFRRVKYIKPDFKDIKRIIPQVVLLFIPIIATSVYRFMDKIMIGKFTNMSNVGYYENSEKMLLISLSVLAAFTTVLLPKMSNMISKKRYDECKELFYKTIQVSICYGMAVGFGLAAVSNDFIPLFFGQKFNESISLSIALSITAPLICCSTIYRDLYLIPNEKDNIYIKAVVIGSIVNFILNCILINIIGVFGAVIATISAEFVLLVFEMYKSKNDIKILFIIKELLLFGFIGLFMFLIIKYFNHYYLKNINSFYRLVLNIIIGGIVYILLSIVILINKENNSIEKIKKNLSN